MLLAPLIAPLVGFLLKEVVIKFFVFAAVFGLVAVLIPVVIGYIGPWLGTEGLTTVFSQLSPAVWFFLDFFNIAFGLPLMISAHITRFLIRRLPIVG